MTHSSSNKSTVWCHYFPHGEKCLELSIITVTWLLLSLSFLLLSLSPFYTSSVALKMTHSLKNNQAHSFSTAHDPRTSILPSHWLTRCLWEIHKQDLSAIVLSHSWFMATRTQRYTILGHSHMTGKCQELWMETGKYCLIWSVSLTLAHSLTPLANAE